MLDWFVQDGNKRANQAVINAYPPPGLYFMMGMLEFNALSRIFMRATEICMTGALWRTR
jgi:hypothetical protein